MKVDLDYNKWKKKWEKNIFFIMLFVWVYNIYLGFFFRYVSFIVGYVVS